MGQGGCELGIEVFGKIKKKKKFGRGSSWWGVRVDKNEELRFLGKFKEIISFFFLFFFFFWGGGGVRVDLNEESNFL